jgi:type I restriction enzyme S subunit
MKRYETYKQGDGFWIKDIPVEWSYGSLNFLVDFVMGQAPHSSSYNQIGEGEVFVKTGDFGKIKPMVKWYTTAPLVFGKEEDVFICVVGATAGKVNLGINGTISRSIAALRPRQKIDQKYLYYFLSYNYLRLNESSQGSAQGIINKDILSSIKLPIPSPQEQSQIASYLNYKTGLIDTIISQKEELIKKLKEQRQAIINEAVTKGLNKDVKLKDSGIEWLGEIPEHWEVVKLRYLSDITTGDKDTENREDDAKYPFFVRSQTIERISSYSFDGEAILTAGDGVGVCKVWHYINGKFDYHQRVYMMHNFRKVTGIYLFNFMKENFINEVLKLSAKSTVDSLRRPMFLEFPVAVPPLEEQSSIIDMLINKQKLIDHSIKGILSSIQKLKEYRQSLISEAVTGKIDVRDWQAPKS